MAEIVDVFFCEVLCDGVAEEEGGVFDAGPDQGRGDAAVETADAVMAERLAETVDWAGVEAERRLGGLGLETDFDGVERVFDEFPRDAGDL